MFALSFNMQMGQAGLLSFGHAILFGLGGYCAAHTLNAVKAGAMWLPIELVPLAGGLGGLVFGALFGYVATQQRATAFAMITMGLGELVAACALMFMGFFGGEGGISTDRVTGTSLLGVAYSSSWQVYCLVVAWTAIAVLLMRLQTQTPLGRMANADARQFRARPVRRLRPAHGPLLPVRAVRLLRRHRRRALRHRLRDRDLRHGGRGQVGHRAAARPISAAPASSSGRSWERSSSSCCKAASACSATPGCSMSACCSSSW